MPPPFPAGPDWLHEIKHDGYRLEGDRVRTTLASDLLSPAHVSKEPIGALTVDSLFPAIPKKTQDGSKPPKKRLAVLALPPPRRWGRLARSTRIAPIVPGA